MPYSIAYTETGKMTAGYAKLVPWAHVEPVGATWPTEMTDAVVEVLECEKDNREQRRKKREERQKNGGSQKYGFTEGDSHALSKSVNAPPEII